MPPLLCQMGPVSRAAWSIGEFLSVAIVINAVTMLGTCELDWGSAALPGLHWMGPSGGYPWRRIYFLVKQTGRVFLEADSVGAVDVQHFTIDCAAVLAASITTTPPESLGTHARTGLTRNRRRSPSSAYPS